MRMLQLVRGLLWVAEVVQVPAALAGQVEKAGMQVVWFLSLLGK